MPLNLTKYINILEDEHYFTRGWTQSIDRYFLKSLLQQRKLKNLIYDGVHNERVIMYCMDRVNLKFGTTFDYHEINFRFNMAYKRYVIFKYIITHPRVIYDPATSTAVADDDTWDSIGRVHSLSAVYKSKGEYSYNILCEIFCLPDHLLPNLHTQPTMEGDRVASVLKHHVSDASPGNTNLKPLCDFPNSKLGVKEKPRIILDAHRFKGLIKHSESHGSSSVRSSSTHIL